MAYLNEAGVTALWNKLKNRDITETSVITKSNSQQVKLVRDGGDATSFTLSGASANLAGLMSAADKTKLDSLAIDSVFSTTSTNAIQNSTVTNLLDGISTEILHSSGVFSVGGVQWHYTGVGQYASRAESDGTINLKSSSDMEYGLGFNTEFFSCEVVERHPSISSLYCYKLQPDQTFTSVKVDTPAAGDSSTLCATTAFVQNAINTAMTSASAFQGTTKDYTTIANAAYKKGWYWVASAAFTLGAESIEIGDMIFCISNKGTASATTDFSVVQANLTSIPTTYIDALS